jgi:polyhydroxyalkanoate synthesis repressor PhaR
MHKIKKYANRKLYDTTDKKYITLEQLTELIKTGEEVSITDNKTGDDITAAIVSGLLAQERKDDTRKVPPSVLFKLLRKGSDTLVDYAKKYSSLWQSALTMAEDEIDKLVNKLVKDKELSESEGSRLKSEIINYTNSLKSWIGQSIDRRINEALSMMKLATREQVADLTGQIHVLAEKVEALEKKLKAKG